MIDLHCHILPGIDDGAKDLATSLAMARMAAADGIAVTACTPHIYPGVYDNSGDGIRAGVARLQQALDEAGIALRLTSGADAHLAPEHLARHAAVIDDLLRPGGEPASLQQIKPATRRN